MAGKASRENGKLGGRPKGSKTQATMDKAAAREVVRQFVIGRMMPMLEAQSKAAEGLSYLVVRNKAGGEFRSVTEAEMESGAFLSDPTLLVEVWKKPPSTQAFTDLMNRALDKPAEQEQQISVTIESRAERVKAARERERSG